MKRMFHTRSFRFGGYSMLASTIVVLIAVVINVLASMLPVGKAQIDVTANQLLSLSEQTEDIVEKLDQELVIYWVSQSEYADDILGGLLSRYAELNDKIRIEKKDPDIYPTFTQKYTSETVLNNSVIIEYGDKSRFVDYYDIFEYDYSTYWYDQTAQVNFAGESAITSAIYFLLDNSVPQIYAITGHGELPADAYNNSLSKQNVDLKSLSLLASQKIPEDADCLIIGNPSVDYSEEETAMVEAFLKNGGSLMLVTDLLTENTGFPNLERLLLTYGVSMYPGVVLEADSDSFISGRPHYLIPALASHTITAPLLEHGYHILLPITQGLTISKELPPDTIVYSLAETSESSYLKSAGYAIETEAKEEGDLEGPFSVAVSITQTVDNDEVSRIVWVPCGALMNEDINRSSSDGNKNFFINAVNWLCGKTIGISIHSKSIATESLVISNKAYTLWSVILVALIPAAYIGMGFYIHARRKRK